MLCPYRIAALKDTTLLCPTVLQLIVHSLENLGLMQKVVLRANYRGKVRHKHPTIQRFCIEDGEFLN